VATAANPRQLPMNRSVTLPADGGGVQLRRLIETPPQASRRPSRPGGSTAVASLARHGIWEKPVGSGLALCKRLKFKGVNSHHRGQPSTLDNPPLEREPKLVRPWRQGPHPFGSLPRLRPDASLESSPPEGGKEDAPPVAARNPGPSRWRGPRFLVAALGSARARRAVQPSLALRLRSCLGPLRAASRVLTPACAPCSR
jgi:hypothetical protein